jgi:hypothetical protein
MLGCGREPSACARLRHGWRWMLVSTIEVVTGGLLSSLEAAIMCNGC